MCPAGLGASGRLLGPGDSAHPGSALSSCPRASHQPSLGKWPQALRKEERLQDSVPPSPPPRPSSSSLFLLPPSRSCSLALSQVPALGQAHQSLPLDSLSVTSDCPTASCSLAPMSLLLLEALHLPTTCTSRPLPAAPEEETRLSHPSAPIWSPVPTVRTRLPPTPTPDPRSVTGGEGGRADARAERAQGHSGGDAAPATPLQVLRVEAVVPGTRGPPGAGAGEQRLTGGGLGGGTPSDRVQGGET